MSNNGSSINRLPKHVAIIMDGNGRWAKSRGLPRVEGHRAGAKTVRKIVEESRRLGIKFLTLYAFSSENWQRPKEEVWALMKLFERYLDSEQKLMLDNDIRLRVIGCREKLAPDLLAKVVEVEKATEHCQAMTLVLAISYGAREELVQATKKIVQRVMTGELIAEQIDADTVQAHLYAPTVPDPDVLIRTSDEFRISNFLLWQLAYSEIVVSSVLWPDFDESEYQRCLHIYSQRSRRYGLTAEQLLEQGAQI